MGASAKKRKAKKAAANQYYKVFSEIKEAELPQRVFSNNKQQVEEQLGDSASYGSKRLAMQMDKSAKEINNNEEYVQDLKNYNNRYAALKKQLAGQSVTRYSVSDAPAKPAGGGGGVAGNFQIGSQNNFGGISGMTNGALGINNTPSSPITMSSSNNTASSSSSPTGTYYNTREEALDAVKKKGLLGNADSYVQSNTLNGITVGYRQLGDMEAAYNDMNKLSKKAGSHKINDYMKQYEAVGNKLRTKVKRDDGVINVNQTGLLNQDLAGADLNTGVIK